MHPFRLLRKLSIKTQIAVLGAIGTSVIATLMAMVSLYFMEDDAIQHVVASQTALVKTVSDNIDSQIGERKKILALSATVLSGATFESQSAFEEYFSVRPVLREHFDALLVTNKDGVIIYDSPMLQGRRGTRINDHYQESMAAKAQTEVAGPLIGNESATPTAAITVPVRTPSGEIIGSLVGMIDLAKNNLFASIYNAKIGKDGYLALVTQADKSVYVAHPVRDRIMTKAIDPRKNPKATPAAHGVEGTVRSIDADNHATLQSYKTLEAAPWALVATYPEAEAFAGLGDRRAQILVFGIGFAMLTGLMLWMASMRLLRPLSNLVEAMRTSLHNPDAPCLAEGSRNREMANLIRIYNLLITRSHTAKEQLARNEAKYRKILTFAGDAFMSIDTNGCISEWNLQAEKIFGWTRDEVLSKPLSILLPQKIHGTHQHAMAHFSRTGEGAMAGKLCEVSVLSKFGESIPVEMSIVPEKNDDGYSANAFLRDISQRKMLEAEIKEREKELRSITDNLPILIGYITPNHHMTFANRTYGEWFGLPAEQKSRHFADLFGGNTYEKYQPYIDRALSGERVSFELEEVSLHGTRQVAHEYVPDFGPDGHVRGMYTMGMDVTSLKEAEQQLQKLARYDALTGLSNRHHLNEKLNEALLRSNRTRSMMAVLYLDIDNFKPINDTMGHATGDEVLKEFATRLKSCLRTTDAIARIGGDEFVIVLEGLQLAEEAQLVARKIISSISKEIVVGGQSIGITTSIGIAVCEGDVAEREIILARADSALYDAKSKGKNAFSIHCSQCE